MRASRGLGALGLGQQLMRRGEAALAQVRVLPDQIKLIGGLDEVTPPYELGSGFVREAKNFEAISEGGYRRIYGYERFSGQPKPSEAIYYILNLTISDTINVADTVNGQTSGATGVVLAVVTTASPNYLVLTKVSGTWQSGENVRVGVAVKGVSSSAAVAGGAATPLLNATYAGLAADNYRADISAVPGSGSVRGVVEYLDTVYAFRNNAGGTAVDIYKSSSGGWVNVPLMEEISFSNANTSVGEGDTLTQGGVTATIQRLIVQTGTLASGTNTGRLVINGRSGGNFAAGAATSTGGGALTLSGAQTAITLSPNGDFEFFIENFAGGTQTKRVYGCDGVNRGFEFDGTVLAPISTGMASDAPNHVFGHKNHLFFSFGPSVQHSGPGTPYVWTPVVGASELAMGDTVTGFLAQPGSADGGALSIFSRNKISILYGTGVSNWQLNTYRYELGAYARTMQDIGYSVYLDDRGITDLKTTADYGNFTAATITDRIKNSINAARTTAIASCISRNSNQYRLFFSSGGAYYLTFKLGRLVGIMPMLFPNVVRCVWSGERIDGSEAIYFGSDSGHVYQMEKGTSFDGAAIEAYFALAYDFQGAPRVNKRYRDATFELRGTGYANFQFGYALGYASTDIPQPVDTQVSVNFSPVFWDSFTWDAFFWDGVTLGPSSLEIDGEAENISLAARSNSSIMAPITVSSILLHHSPRGRLRG